MQKSTRPATLDDLVSMRQQINEDLDTAFRKMQSSLKTYIDTEISKLRADTLSSQQKIQHDVQTMSALRDSTKPSHVSMKGVADDAKSLTVISPEIRGEMMGLITRETTTMANKVIKIINDNINGQIMPKIQRTMDWIDYNTQDGTQLVTDYRANMTRELHSSSNSKLMIGDGHENSHFSTHNGAVSMYFNEDD